MVDLKSESKIISEFNTNFALLAQKVLEEINTIRRFPSSFTKKLENLLSNFQGSILKIGDYRIKLKEGIDGLQGAISYLKSINSPLEPFIQKEGLKSSSQSSVTRMISQNGFIMNNDEVVKTVNAFGNSFGTVNQLVDLAFSDPFLTILKFILSDGDHLRHDRSILFNKNIKNIGICCRSSSSGNFILCIHLVELYFNKNEFIPQSCIQRFHKLEIKNTPLSENNSGKNETIKPFVKPLVSMFKKNNIDFYQTEPFNLNKKPSFEKGDHAQTLKPRSISPENKDRNNNNNNNRIFGSTIKTSEFDFTMKSFMDASIQPINEYINENGFNDNKNDQGNTMKNFKNFNFEEDFDELPEGIDRVEIREKPINKAEKKYFVKKTIFFSNGTNETYYYEK